MSNFSNKWKLNTKSKHKSSPTLQKKEKVVCYSLKSQQTRNPSGPGRTINEGQRNRTWQWGPGERDWNDRLDWQGLLKSKWSIIPSIKLMFSRLERNLPSNTQGIEELPAMIDTRLISPNGSVLKPSSDAQKNISHCSESSRVTASGAQ